MFRSKLKNLVALLLCVLMIGSMFTGCTKDEKGKDNEPTTGTEVEKKDDTKDDAKDDTKEPEPVELTLWFTSREQDDFSKQQEEAFLKEHPHITLNKVVKEGDPGNELFQGIAAGNAPDVLSVSFTMMDKYMKAGILAPLNDYVDAWEHGAGLTQHYLDQLTVDGNLYGLPDGAFPMFFGYNKRLFEEAGLEGPPTTWEQAIEYAKILTVPEKQQNGYSTVAAEWTEWYFQYYVWQAGGDLTKLNADGTIELTFTDPAVIEAANYYKELAAEGVLQSDLTLKFGAMIERFAAGKIGMLGFAGDWVSWATSLGMDPDDIGLALFPAGPGGTATAVTGHCRVINGKSSPEKQEAAWEYIEFYTRPDYMRAEIENKASKGAVNPVVIPRDDLQLGDIIDIPEEYSKVLIDVQKGGRGEFAGKAQVGIYVDRVIQKLLTDPNADPVKEFELAQKLAQKEVIDKYNKDVLNNK